MHPSFRRFPPRDIGFAARAPRRSAVRRDSQQPAINPSAQDEALAAPQIPGSDGQSAGAAAAASVPPDDWIDPVRFPPGFLPDFVLPAGDARARGGDLSSAGGPAATPHAPVSAEAAPGSPETVPASPRSAPGSLDAAPASLDAAPGSPQLPAPPPAPRLSWRERLARARQRKRELYEQARAAGRALPRCYGKGQSCIEYLLTEKHRDAYYALLRRPDTTVRIASGWLAFHGYCVGETAVRRHLAAFRARMLRHREAAELSHTIAAVSRERGVASVADASAALAEQQMMRSLLNVLREDQEGEEFDPDHWRAIHRAVGEAIRNRQTIESLRKSAEEKKDARPAESKYSGMRLALRVRHAVGVITAKECEQEIAKIDVLDKAEGDAGAEAHPPGEPEPWRKE